MTTPSRNDAARAIASSRDPGAEWEDWSVMTQVQFYQSADAVLALIASPPTAAPTREAVRIAVGGVVTSGSNHPDPIRAWGRDYGKLIELVADAVMAIMPGEPTTDQCNAEARTTT